MKVNSFLKLFLIAPIATTPVGFLSNCHKKIDSDTEFMIVQPSDEESLTQIQTLVDGSVTFLYKNFQYNVDISSFDSAKFSLQAPGFSNYATSQSGKCVIYATNLNEENKTFDVEVSFSDVFTSTDPIKTNFIFYYDDKELKSDKPEYSLFLLGETKKANIGCPAFEKVNENIYSGTFYFLAKGFYYEGIKNIDDLIVEVSNTSSNNAKNSNSEFFCQIVNIDKADKTFDLEFHGAELETGDFNLLVQFKLNSSIVPCTQQEFAFSLLDDRITHDFRQDDWDIICSLIRRKGLSGLKDRYKIQSFIGLKKQIILKNGLTYTVRIIGQNHDELNNKDTSEGLNAALTFMFEQALTIKDTTNPQTLIWDNTLNIWKYQTTKEAYIRNWLNNEFKNNLLPSYISSWIPRVVKKTILHFTHETIESLDYVFLPSLVELGGSVDSNERELLDEGKCYENFKNIGSNDVHSKRQRKAIGGSLNVNYWLRTPSLTTTTSNVVYGCHNGGLIASMEYFLITNQCSVLPCFCL